MSEIPAPERARPRVRASRLRVRILIEGIVVEFYSLDILSARVFFVLRCGSSAPETAPHARIMSFSFPQSTAGTRWPTQDIL